MIEQLLYENERLLQLDRLCRLFKGLLNNTMRDLIPNGDRHMYERAPSSRNFHRLLHQQEVWKTHDISGNRLHLSVKNAEIGHSADHLLDFDEISSSELVHESQ